MSGNRYMSDARLAALAASAEAKRVQAARVWAAFTARRRRDG
jgi:hypothetical protein